MGDNPSAETLDGQAEIVARNLLADTVVGKVLVEQLGDDAKLKHLLRLAWKRGRRSVRER